jgi:TPR repeat protein
MLEKGSDAYAMLGKGREIGSAKAMHELGCCLCQGGGMIAEPCEGKSWWRKAAANGHVPAMISLAIWHDTDSWEAMFWLKKAAETGDPDAMWRVGCQLGARRGIGAERVDAAVWYWKAADAGDVMGAFSLMRFA